MVIRKYKLSSYAETKRLIGECDNYPEPILFREKLYVFDEDGKKIGRFSLNIDQEENANSIVYVHISNRAYVNGRLSETIVTGTVSNKLRTLEEIRYECTEVPNTGMHERCMFLLRETTRYYLSVTNTMCEIRNRMHTTISFSETLGMIGECANALLLRKLARQGYEGIFCLKTVLSNGKRCRNYYVTKLSKILVNGKKMEVLIIYRNITNHKKCNVTMTMALTRAGQIIYLFWSNSKCFLHIDPDAEIKSTHAFSYAETSIVHNWHKDIQLHSLYLDALDTNIMKFRKFKYKNDQLRRILANFVEYLLLVKPKDVICYAIEYFSAFGHNCKTKCASKVEPMETASSHSFSLGEYESAIEQEPPITPWLGECGYILNFSEA